MGIRIGGASAFYGDSQLAARQLVEHGDIDYLVFDYLAEVTMAILARSALKNPQLGYALDFVTVAMADVLADCADKGIKVIANAGGVNVPGCIAALEALCQQQGLDLKIAGVHGDNLIGRDDLPLGAMTEIQSGDAYPDQPVSANTYFGAAPIADALAAGADVVVTGRVVDSAVVLGPLIHEYKWSLDDYDRLAQGALCGHVIECGAQCTGGNFTDWHLVPDFSNMSYPVADVDASGVFNIGIPSGSGGIATVGSVAEQIVYEIGDPANYLLPDVACDFSDVRVEQVAKDLVKVSGAKGRAPGEQYKVCATWVDGFRLTSSFFMAGPRSANKARAALEAWLARTRKIFTQKGWGDYRRVSIEIAGAEDTYGPHSKQQDSREVMGKYGVHHDHKEALVFASMEMAYLATSGPPAMTGFGAGRARPQPLMRVHSTMINKSAVPVIVQLGNKVIINQYYLNDASRASESPSLATIAKPDESLEMQAVSLETLAYARSGDKGDNANIGIICRKPEFLPYIEQQLSADVVKNHLAHLVDGDVTRFYIPGFYAFNFYLTQALGGGGTASLRLDSQAKTYAQMLLSLEISIPRALL